MIIRFPPRAGRRPVPRCFDCGRRIWSTKALRRRLGLLLGEGCYRKRVQAARLTDATRRASIRIRVRSPGHIPTQLVIQFPPIERTST
ncbi:hypothetical protein ACIBH1_40810 [Nonomuraea sp. NPDC050663]|uniref:hypothetical protein n=1 Tax=Nonomuraea sp. NPDC050663 TaxID=3364370 RepID=UPI0037949500